MESLFTNEAEETFKKVAVGDWKPAQLITSGESKYALDKFASSTILNSYKSKKNMLQHPVPEEHLKWIGDITVSFALLESQLQILIGAHLSERQRVGQIITAELSFRGLKSLLMSLYIEQNGEDQDFERLNELVQRSGKVEKIRNSITHSVWGAGKDPDHVTRIKATAKQKTGIKFSFKDVSSQKLEDFALDIKMLASDFQKFYIDLLAKNKITNNSL